MLKLCLSALGYGLLGAFFVPVVAFLGSLALFHALVPQCGSPGDSGGCEMSAGMIGLGSAIPGLVGGVAFGLYKGRRRARTPTDAAPAGDRAK